MNEQQLRRVIRQILSESKDASDIVLEYDGGMTTHEYRDLFRGLTDPFVNVFKAVALTGQDVLNSLRLMFDTLTTLSPSKLKKARENYNKRNEKISAKWEPVLKIASDAINNSDAGLVLFALNPAEYIGVQFAKLGLKTIASIPDYLEKSGWEIPLLKSLGVISASNSKSKEEDKPKPKRKLPLNTRIKNIFYGDDYGYTESVTRTSNLLNEEDESKPGITPQNFRKSLDDYLTATGLDSELNDLYTQLYNSKKLQIDEIMNDVINQISVLKEFSDATTLEQFDNIVNKASSKNIDVSVIEKKISTLKSDMNKKIKEVRKNLENDKKNKMSEEEIEKAVEEAANNVASEAIKALVNDSKESLNKALASMRTQVEETLTADWPDDKSAVRASLSKTAAGKKYLDLIDDALNSIVRLKEVS